MDPVRQTGTRWSLSFALAVILSGALAAPAPGQTREPDRPRYPDPAGDPAAEAFLDVARARAGGFRLFAASEAAISGMRLRGNFGTYHDTYGPCDSPLTGFCLWLVSNTAIGVGASFNFFEVMYAAGAPPSEWARIRRVAPEAANARGGGYTSLMNRGLFAGRAEWGPRDGTLGALFSGVTSTSDGSCRDHTGFHNGFVSTGLQLLAGSDCPETWPGGDWRGDRPIRRDGWEALFAEQGSGFRWDYWRVPDSLKAPDAYLGDHYATYGESSDHYADILEGYGAAIPGGEGEPAFAGYPLGLVWRFEAFNFRQPGFEAITYWRATVVNRSEDVWGAGIDYDSLYLGFWEGTGGTSGGSGGGSRYANYYLPDLGLGLYHQSGMQGAAGPCGDPGRLGPGIVPCAGSGRGYGHGGNAIIVLKSPIGDLRNKLFTRRPDGSPCTAGVDPFCDPSHPLRGDTITFNHGHMCGFGGCWASTHNVNDRRSFGVLSSTEDNTIDGQALTPGSFAWRTFRNIGYPSVMGRYNKYVPGVQGPPAATWDWNHDGTPDTLFYDTCGPAGCVTTDWDTMPGGQVNAYGNVGGVLAAGPVRLAAGDSTSWFVAFVAEADSARSWAAFHNAITHYLELFPRPERPPAPAVTAVQTGITYTAGARARPAVTLVFDAEAEHWVDPFLAREADRLEAAPPGSGAGELVAANPWLVDSLRQRAANNIEAIEVYKSCDGGRTFTGDADCLGDPSLDPSGNPLGTGWRWYARFAPEADGALPNTFTDSAVAGGKTYHYVFVTRTKGASFLVDRPLFGLERQVFAHPMQTRLAVGPAVPAAAEVYLPVSPGAGSRAAFAELSAVPASVTAPFGVTVSDAPTPGTYRAVFGNRLVVVRDSVEGRADVDLTVRVEHVVPAYPTGVDTVVGRRTFETVTRARLPVTGTPSDSQQTTGPTTVRTTVRYDGLGLAVVDAGGAPVFVSLDLRGGPATPDVLLGSPFDPGFLISADHTVAGTFDSSGTALMRARPGDTVPRAIADLAAVQWLPGGAARTRDGSGRYEVVWSDDPFGLAEGVTLDNTRPHRTGRELLAALAGRITSTVTLADAATGHLVGVDQTRLQTQRLPFALYNRSFDRPVHVVALRRPDRRIVLGGGADTVAVDIPLEAWVPGDTLILVEDVAEDSTISGEVVLEAGGEPIEVIRRKVSFHRAVLGCAGERPRCNPVHHTSPGATAYVPIQPGDVSTFHYYAGFQPGTEIQFRVTGREAGGSVAPLTAEDLATIRVVPNPFVLYSAYQPSAGEPRVLFTNVPPEGTLRLYTVSGQFVQQITWTAADLQGAGDLHVNLVTREGEPMASGLYVWVLTAPSRPGVQNSVVLRVRGKLVVIQGGVR